MATRGVRSQVGGASNDTKSMAALRLGDFALLDKILLLEASLQRSPGLPDGVRASLVQQVAALKDDVRVLCIVLVGEAPARTGPIPLPGWARSDTPDDEATERLGGG
jgi:hypothetical protein